MLTLVLPEMTIDDTTILPIEVHLEHSLVSLSKWESITEKPFFGRETLDREETNSYIEHMVIGENPPKGWLDRLTSEDYASVTNYINSKQSATWFNDAVGQRGPKEIVTNELIYYWMISFQIPFDPCEHWHLSRLMTLIRICGIKQTKPKNMNRSAIAEQYRQLNEQRRAKLGTAG